MLSHDISTKFENLNLHFLKNYLNYDAKLRKSNPYNPYNTVQIKEFIKSGDIFVLSRFSGLDPFLSWGTGSKYGHIAIAI